MKIVVGLYGKANIGKTQTLKSLINLFYKENDETGNLVEIVPYIDVYRVIEYHDTKICIATGGDNKHIIDENCMNFHNNVFDIAITAARSKGETLSTINDFAEAEEADLKLFEKASSYNIGEKYEKIIIKNTAKILFQYIKELIDARKKI